jgi:hypothetical protein
MGISPKEYIQNLRDKLIALEVAEPHEIIGCTEAELETLMASQGIHFLPELYQEFLLMMGKQAGLLHQGTDARYKYLLNIKEAALELLQENDNPFELPADAFVFQMHQGYEFFYFLTGDKSQNPPIYRYLEGTDVAGFKVWNSLFDYFDIEIEREIVSWSGHIERRKQKGLSPRPKDGMSWHI